MPYERRNFPLMPIPQVRGPDMGNLAMLARFAMQGERERQARRAAQEQQQLIASAFQAADNDPEEAGRALMQSGHYDIGQSIMSNAANYRGYQQNALRSHLQRVEQELTSMASVLQPVYAAGTEEAAIQAYAKIYPYAQRLTQHDDSLAKQLPAPGDGPAIQQFAKNLYPTLLSGAEVEKQRAEALGRYMQSPQDQRALHGLMADMLPTFDTGAELDEALTVFEEQAGWGKQPGIRALLGKLPDELSNEWKANKAQRFGARFETPDLPTPGSAEAHVRAWARERNLDPNALTSDQIEQARASYAEAGRAPRTPTDQDEFTQSQLNVVLRDWFRNRQQVIDRSKETRPDFDELGKEIQVPIMDDRDVEQALTAVDEQFYKQLKIGRPPHPNMVLMQAPTGEFGWVPRSRVNEAEADGALILHDPGD